METNTDDQQHWLSVVDRVVAVWSGYQLAVDYNSGGSETIQKHEWFVSVLAEFIYTTRPLNADTLEQWINNVLYHDFDLVLDDDSVYPTSCFLIEAFGYAKNKNSERLTQLLSTLPSADQVRSVKQQSRVDTENDQNEMEMSDEEDDEEQMDDGKLARYLQREIRTFFKRAAAATTSLVDGTMSHCGADELRANLEQATKETHHLWEENKDSQGRFVNDLGELQRIQVAITQLETEHRQDQLLQARHSLAEMQRHASALYELLVAKRAEIVKKLNDGTQVVALLQNQLIGERLFEWKNRQKLSQLGVPFDNKDTFLDDVQMEFEFLADHNWQLHMFTCWMLDLLTRSPQLNDNNAQQTKANLQTLSEQLIKLLFMLISQSFVVSVQPEPVLKTQHKFVTEVRLLIGDKLGIRQHLVRTDVAVTIISEEEAKLLSATQLNHKDIKTVGSISNDREKLTMDENGHLAAKFNNSKLTRIAHRKPPPKGSAADIKCSALTGFQAATDQKYALLFQISPFQLGNLGQFDVWTLSLPLMVTVHGSQDCDAQGAILWQRAFASVVRVPAYHDMRTPVQAEINAVGWPDLAHALKHKFSLFTGARRPLCDADLAYLSEKLVVPNMPDQKPITFHRFAKHNLRDDVSFSFWEWFFSIMQLIKQKLLKYWDEGWLVGFISKQDASSQMLQCPHNTFLLRFSDTQTGAVSIGFVAEDDDGQKVPFHLAPFSIKDLDQLSLAQRIASCPQLKEIRYMYPSMDKEEILRYFDTEERHKGVPDSPTGYIQSEIVMVAKTSGKMSSAASFFGADSPGSAHSKLDWSPGEVAQQHDSNSMDIGDDLASILSASALDPVGGDVETLLGPGFRLERAQLPQQPLQHIDLSFVDSFAQGSAQFYKTGQHQHQQQQ